jgi:chemotaxis protein methyltransferase CheR
MSELGIVDIREIVRTIKAVHDLDFSNYALTSLKQRFEKFMNLHSIPSADILMIRLNNDPSFIDTILYGIAVPSTEMFRDPSLWRWLRESFFNEYIDKQPGRFKIWFPVCVSGGELFSLAILLREMGLLNKVNIVASYTCDAIGDQIMKGSYDIKKIDVSQENYKRANGSKDLSNYYKTEKNSILRDTSLIEDVDFRKLNITFDNAPQNVRLILFRNHLIYHNPTQQERALRLMYESLSVNGHLVLGIRERITGISGNKEFELVNETESVYRKKLSS